MTKATLRLNAAELASPCWDKVETHATEHLKAYRAVAENPLKSEAERLSAAHRIDELKQLLRLAQPVTEQPDDEADH